MNQHWWECRKQSIQYRQLINDLLDDGSRWQSEMAGGGENHADGGDQMFGHCFLESRVELALYVERAQGAGGQPCASSSFSAAAAYSLVRRYRRRRN
jgi:hypothetical protein